VDEEQWLVKIDMFADFFDPGDADSEIDRVASVLTAGGYRGFALLRLSRAAALFAAQSIFVQAGVPYDKAFLDTVQKDSKD